MRHWGCQAPIKLPSLRHENSPPIQGWVITPFASYGAAGLLVYGLLAGLAAAPAAPGGAPDRRWPGLGFLARVLGALLLAILTNGLAVLRADTFAQQMLLGSVTIGAVVLDQLTRRFSR